MRCDCNRARCLANARWQDNRRRACSWGGFVEGGHSTATSHTSAPSLRSNPAGHIHLPHLRSTTICALHRTSLIADRPWYSEGRARGSTQQQHAWEPRRRRKPEQQAGCLCPWLGVAPWCSSLSALHSTVGVGSRSNFRPPYYPFKEKTCHSLAQISSAKPTTTCLNSNPGLRWMSWMLKPAGGIIVP